MDSRAVGSAYPRLEECDIDVMAVLPRLGDVEIPLLGTFDVVIVGCNGNLVMNQVFERRIVQAAALTRVLGVTPQPTSLLAAQAARIGFHGLVAREVQPDAFERAVAAVIRGELAFPRSTFNAVVRLIRRAYQHIPGRDEKSDLTPRQRQIVDLIAQGANDREIADALQISSSTVHKHVQNALKRTNTKTRSHLAAAMGQSS